MSLDFFFLKFLTAAMLELIVRLDLREAKSILK